MITTGLVDGFKVQHNVTFSGGLKYVLLGGDEVNEALPAKHSELDWEF